MIYVLFGADDFSLRGKLEDLKSELGDEESLALNTTFFEAQQLTLSQLIGAIQAIPFLGSNRLVIVEGLLSRFEQKEGRRDLDFGEWQSLDDCASQMPATTVLILIDGKIAKNNPLLKKLAPISEVQEFPQMKGARLEQWIDSCVAKCGGRISPRAVKLLNELAGENLWVLSSEIEKLCLYSRGRRIEEEDARRITTYAREVSVFAMVDAIVEKRAPTAMQLLHQLSTEGMAPAYLLFMLTRQLRLMVQARELDAHGLSAVEKQKQLGVSPNFPIDKLLRQSARYPMPRLIEIYQKLLDTDIAIKTGKWQDKLALDLLVAEVCS